MASGWAQESASEPPTDQPSERTTASALTSRSARLAAARGPWRPSTKPAGVRSWQRRVVSAGAPSSSSQAGSTSVSTETPPASGVAASPYGSRAVSRGRFGSMAAPSWPVGAAETHSTGTPPRRPTCTSGRPSEARTTMRTTSEWLRRNSSSALSAAWRSSDAAAGSRASSSRAMVGEPPRKARSERTPERRPSSAPAREATSSANARRASSSAPCLATRMPQRPARLTAATAARAITVSHPGVARRGFMSVGRARRSTATTIP